MIHIKIPILLGPFASMVEEYADNQDLWVEDFGSVYTKMLDNVYDSTGQKVTLTKGGKIQNYCDSNYQRTGKKIVKGLCANTL